MLSRFSSKEQASFNFMAAVTICSDLEPKKIKSVTVSIISPSICHEVMGPDAMILDFWILSFKSAFSLSSFFHFPQEGSLVLQSLKLLIFLSEILILACASSGLAFHMMYIQPWHTPFLIWNQSVVPCLVLTVASWPAYRFLRRQVRWSGIPISLIIFHSLLWSTQSKEVKVFLEFSCFFDDPMDVGNLISGSSAFSKSSLYTWKFCVHVLLKPSLKDLSITLLACEMSAIVR